MSTVKTFKEDPIFTPALQWLKDLPAKGENPDKFFLNSKRHHVQVQYYSSISFLSAPVDWQSGQVWAILSPFQKPLFTPPVLCMLPLALDLMTNFLSPSARWHLWPRGRMAFINNRWSKQTVLCGSPPVQLSAPDLLPLFSLVQLISLFFSLVWIMIYSN